MWILNTNKNVRHSSKHLQSQHCRGRRMPEVYWLANLSTSSATSERPCLENSMDSRVCEYIHMCKRKAGQRGTWIYTRVEGRQEGTKFWYMPTNSKIPLKEISRRFELRSTEQNAGYQGWWWGEGRIAALVHATELHCLDRLESQMFSAVCALTTIKYSSIFSVYISQTLCLRLRIKNLIDSL